MDYLDSEIIILEVQKHPCLYDTNIPDYKNKEMKRDSWISVMKALLGEMWNEIGDEQRSELGIEVQKRWKSMKDSYVKFIKTQNMDLSISKKPYIFHRQLAFLQPIFQGRESTGNIKQEQDAGLQEAGNPNKDQRGQTNDKEELETSTETAGPSFVQNFLRLPRKRKSGADSFEDAVARNTEKSKKDALDPDEMFLLSQVPLIKKLTPHQKLDFQIKFLQLLLSYSSPANNK